MQPLLILEAAGLCQSLVVKQDETVHTDSDGSPAARLEGAAAGCGGSGDAGCSHSGKAAHWMHLQLEQALPDPCASPARHAQGCTAASPRFGLTALMLAQTLPQQAVSMA